MKILQKLYLRDFILLLCLITIGLSAIFSLLELMGKLDDFLAAKSLPNLLFYVLFNIPKSFLYLLPMSVLICSLFVFSQAARRNEIIAIKTAGGRLRILFYPFVVAGLILSIIAFFTGEFIVPDFSKKAVVLKNYVQGRNRLTISTEGGMWLKNKDGYPVKIDLYVIDRQIATGVVIFETGESSLQEKIVADEAFWNGKVWVLKNITKYNFESGNVERLEAMDYHGLESPDFFTEEMKSPDEMSIRDIYRYIQRLRNAGFNNIKLSVDVHSKISFPLINIFMMMLGISLSVRLGLGGGLFSAGLGLFISLLYWFSYTFFLSLGYAGILPPLISAWTIPLIFAVLGLFLFLTIPE